MVWDFPLTLLKESPIPENNRSISTAQLVSEAVEGFKNNQYEIACGLAKNMIENSRTDIHAAFEKMNSD